MLVRGGRGGDGGLPNITRLASGRGLCGIEGTVGCCVVVLGFGAGCLAVFNATIGRDRDVSVLSGLGGGMGGEDESVERTAPPGPRDVRTLVGRAVVWTLALLLLPPPSVFVVGEWPNSSTGGIGKVWRPSCIASAVAGKVTSG